MRMSSDSGGQGAGGRGSAKSVGGCLISNGSGVLVRARRDPHGDDEGVYSIPSQRGHAAMSSSTTTALSRQPLAQVLRNLTDPRDRRGVRHDLPTVLSLAVTGVLAGCRSLTAIWEHTTDLTAADLEALSLQVGQALASESTIRRVLQDLDPTDLDTHVRSWFCTRTGTIEGMDCQMFFGQCLFVFQAAFVKFRSSRSTSFGVRYPRAE